MMLWGRVEAEMPERRELVQALLCWASVARRESGAMAAHLCEDLEEPGVYCLSSTWKSEQDLEAHVAGPDFGILLGALEVLGRRSQLEVTGSPEGAEDAVSLIRRVRGRSPALDHAGGLWSSSSAGRGV